MQHPMSQSEIMGHLNFLAATYPDTDRFLFPLNTAASPNFTDEITRQFFYEPPVPAESIIGNPRSDRGDTMFADVHSIARNAGKPLLDQIKAAVKTQPSNTDLAIVAKVADDIYSALNATYNAGKKVENSFKQSIRNEKGGTFESRIKAAGIEWKERRYTVLPNDPSVADAHARLEDIKALGHQPYKADLLVANYGKEFPNATDEDKLLEAIVLGEKIAVYNFVAKQALFELSDPTLENFLTYSFEPAEGGAKELAEICDRMANAPYNVPLGINLSEIRPILAGHSRQVQIYAVVEELVQGKKDLRAANEHLVALGAGESAEIKTSKEMAVLVAGVAYSQNNEEWQTLAEALMDAKSTNELQDVITAGQAAFDDIAGLKVLPDTALEKAQSFIADAKSRANELDINLPAAAKRVRAQEAASRSGGCPMHK